MVQKYLIDVRDVEPEKFVEEEGFKGFDSKLVISGTTVGSGKKR